MDGSSTDLAPLVAKSASTFGAVMARIDFYYCLHVRLWTVMSSYPHLYTAWQGKQRHAPACTPYARLNHAASVAAVVRLLDDPSRRRPLVKSPAHLPSRLGVRGRLVPGRHAVQADGKLGGDVRGGLGVDLDRVPVDVIEVVAGLVVADVPGGTRAGEEAAAGDAELQEADVVGGGAKLAAAGCKQLRNIIMQILTGGFLNLPVLGRLALGLEVVEQRLRAVLVVVVVGVDGVLGLEAANHVVVEVELDLVGLFLLELRGVVQRADQAAPRSHRLDHLQ